MCAGLIKTGDSAKQLCKHFKHLQSDFEKEVATLGKKASAKVGTAATTVTVGIAAVATPLALAAALFDLPASMPFIASVMEDLDESKNKEKEKNYVFYVSKTVTHSLVPAIQNFTAALRAVAGYYAGLEVDLRNSSVEQKKVHYLRSREKAQEVIENCQTFLQMLPAAHINLLSVEN